MRKTISPFVALAIACLAVAGCQTTPPKSQSPSAPPASQQSRAAGAATASQPAAQLGAQEPEASPQGGQPTANVAPAAQGARQGVQPQASSGRRPAIGTTATGQLRKLGTGVSTTIGGLIHRVAALFSIKPAPARKQPAPAPRAAPERAPLVSADVLPMVVIGGVILAGCLLGAAMIVAGRRGG